MNFTRIALATAVLALSSAAANAIDISGAGATFPYPIYAKWADAYKKETGNGLNYQSIGSGGGIKQIKAKTVTFGATDAPLPGKELDESGLAQFPMVMGAIVPVVNLDGIKPGELTLDGPTVAKIYLGEIKKWDDPAIAKLNPGAKLPKPGDRAGAPLRRLGHDLQLRLLSGRDQPRVEGQGRRQHGRAVAGRHRRQGQRRRRQQRRQHQGLDRLRRVRLRQAEQAHPHQDGEQGGQDGRAVVGHLPGRGRQRRLEVRSPATASSWPTSPATSPGR